MPFLSPNQQRQRTEGSSINQSIIVYYGMSFVDRNFIIIVRYFVNRAPGITRTKLNNSKNGENITRIQTNQRKQVESKMKTFSAKTKTDNNVQYCDNNWSL